MQSFEEWQREINKWQTNTSTHIIGKNIILLAEIPSTNMYLKENLQFPNGTIATAYIQTQGKGQRNRKWISNPGGLYLSIKFDIRPLNNFSPFWITAIVAIGLCKALETLNFSPRIKWPNDVLVNDKKVAGILTETIMTNNNITFIIGIGCNVNNSLDEIMTNFPELLSKITSLSSEEENHRQVSISSILEPTILFLESKLVDQNQINIANIRSEWLTYCQIEKKHVEILKLDSGDVLQGEIIQVTDSGSLLFKKNSGKIEEITSGEVKIQQERS